MTPYVCGECGPVSDDAEAHRAESILRSLALAASGAPLSWWWLSFCDTDRPKGTHFLGVCVVEGWDILSAVSRAHELGCNPGGEVAAYLLPGTPDPAWCNRLLSRDEAETMPEPTL